MSKPKFDPSLIQDRSPSGGLEPLDFMRPMSKEKQAPKPKSPTPSTASKRKVSRADTPASDLPMPPARRAEARIMLVCRVTPDLDKRLRQFCQAHNASMQDTVTLAINEFLERRAA
jgi:hypothetical protein